MGHAFWAAWRRSWPTRRPLDRSPVVTRCPDGGVDLALTVTGIGPCERCKLVSDQPQGGVTGRPRIWVDVTSRWGAAPPAPSTVTMTIRHTCCARSIGSVRGKGKRAGRRPALESFDENRCLARARHRARGCAARALLRPGLCLRDRTALAPLVRARGSAHERADGRLGTRRLLRLVHDGVGSELARAGPPARARGAGRDDVRQSAHVRRHRRRLRGPGLVVGRRLSASPSGSCHVSHRGPARSAPERALRQRPGVGAARGGAVGGRRVRRR